MNIKKRNAIINKLIEPTLSPLKRKKLYYSSNDDEYYSDSAWWGGQCPVS